MQAALGARRAAIALAALPACAALSPPALAAGVVAEWDRGPSWVRDVARPSDAWPDVPRSAPEIAVHVSDVEGGRDAAWRNAEGRRVRAGVHATLEAGARLATPGGRAALRVRPRASVAADAARLAWLEALASVRLGPAALEAGRTRLWLGPARHGALLLSTNARPLDLVHLRASGRVASRLPVLAHLRGVSGGVALVWLRDAHRDFPDPHLGVMHVSSSYGAWLEVGLYRTLLFAGEGRGFRWNGDAILDLLLARGGENDPNPDENLADQLAAFSVRVRLDALFDGARDEAGDRGDSSADRSRVVEGDPDRDGLWVFYEYAGEDNLKGWLVRSPAVAIGMTWAHRGAEVWFELANNRRNESEWYTHAVYQSGYTLRGVVLGHHMGGDAQDAAIGVAAPVAGGRRLALFLEREEALFNERDRIGRPPAARWTAAASAERLARVGRVAIAVDLIARWGDEFPIEALGAIERKRASVRLAWSPE